MRFGAAATTFKTLADAQSGQQYEITIVKNPQGYNDWTACSPANGAASHSDAPAAAVAGKANATPRSTYETPEERAQRQVLIVRQSSLSNAVSCLAVGSKSPPQPAEVIAVANASNSALTESIGSNAKRST